MIKRIGEGDDIKLGSEFLKFGHMLPAFTQGLVVAIDDETVDVDFGDFVIRWIRHQIKRYMMFEGYYMEFYSSPDEGRIINHYR